MPYDPYCYSNSNVLKNKLDIRDERELAKAESSVAAVALLALQDGPLKGPVNEGRLKKTHLAIFGELYDWAGSYRENVGRMTKGRKVGHQVTYGDSRFVPEEMKRIFEN
jgi:fido (protein-threonine AMPylation protein)